ncbi:uncharacterized protein [Nicotiana sylvestris]|uniref:uncharacterized protein n=1 Tax=Nicotiana sylvestris TaxID=4096 RepID=UPI00388CB38A
MKTTAENPARSRQDEKLINSLRRKVCDYGADLEMDEEELAKTRARLAHNVEGREKFVQRLKERYDKEVTVLKKNLTILENEMAQQAKNFKSEREHCYALISQLEESVQQLQDQNNADTQMLEARAQQIVIADLDRLQQDIAQRHAQRSDDVPQAPRAPVEALIYS